MFCLRSTCRLCGTVPSRVVYLLAFLLKQGCVGRRAGDAHMAQMFLDIDETNGAVPATKWNLTLSIAKLFSSETPRLPASEQLKCR